MKTNRNRDKRKPNKLLSKRIFRVVFYTTNGSEIQNSSEPQSCSDTNYCSGHSFAIKYITSKGGH